jgi:hypothetical protein
MSTILQNKEKPNLNEKNINNKEIEEKPENKEEKINPLSLLSKDLLEQINSLDEIDFGEKKDKETDYIQLDDTQRESGGNEEDNEYILETEKETDNKDFFGYDIFKNDENEKSNNSKEISSQEGRFSQPIPYHQQIINFNLNQCDDSNLFSPIGRFSYDCHKYQSKNESFNQLINNPYQNPLNFFNNSFTMNGKSGWVCSHCKNFNYESKFLYKINKFLFL